MPPQKKINPEDFQDPDVITKQVTEILGEMIKEDVQSIRKNSEKEFKKYMKTRFPEFSKENKTLMRVILEGGKLDMLFLMLNEIRKIKNNKSKVFQSEKKIGQCLKEQYLDPKL